jgi:hypothetical protein
MSEQSERLTPRFWRSPFRRLNTGAQPFFTSGPPTAKIYQTTLCLTMTHAGAIFVRGRPTHRVASVMTWS